MIRNARNQPIARPLTTTQAQEFSNVIICTSNGI